MTRTIGNIEVPNHIPRGIIPKLGCTTVNMLWSLNCWARGAMMVYCNLMVMTMIDSSKVFKILDSGELGCANFYSPGI